MQNKSALVPCNSDIEISSLVVMITGIMAQCVDLLKLSLVFFISIFGTYFKTAVDPVAPINILSQTTKDLVLCLIYCFIGYCCCTL